MTAVFVSSRAAWNPERNQQEPFLSLVLLRRWLTTPCTESPGCWFRLKIPGTQHTAWMWTLEGPPFVSSSPDLRIAILRDEWLCQQAWEKALTGCHSGYFEDSHPLHWCEVKWITPLKRYVTYHLTFFHPTFVDYVFRVKAESTGLTKTQFLPLRSSKSSGRNRKESQKSQQYGNSTGSIHKAF